MGEGESEARGWGRGTASLVKGNLNIKTDTVYLTSALDFEKALGLGQHRGTDPATGPKTKPLYPLFCNQIYKSENMSINKTSTHYDILLVWGSAGLHR